MSRMFTHMAWSTIYILLLGMGLFAACAPAWAAEPDPLSRVEERRRAVAAVMEESTVLILVAKKNEMTGMGSGFVVADGYVLTNAHVINAGDTYFIANEGMPPVKGKLVKKLYSKDSGVADFALLRFAPPKPLPILPFNLKVGRMDRVSAWGFPYMVTQFDQSTDRVLEGNFEKMPPVVFTEGSVSVVVNAGKAKNIIHTAAIAAGNSGGPLVNSRGEVVGINTWGYKEESEGAFVNASLPAELIVAFLKSCGVNPRTVQSGSGLAGVARPAPAHPAESAAPSASSASSTHGGIAAAARKAQAQQDGEGPVRGGLASAAARKAQQNTAQEDDPDASRAVGDEEGLSDDAKGWLAEARKGDAEAQAVLGVAYYTGDDAPQNVDMAVHWLDKAVAQGEPIAQHFRGIICLTESAYKDVPRALDLLREAADADAELAPLLAWALYEGEPLGVARDVDGAAKYAALGAKAGDEDAQALLAILMYYGEGIKQDQKGALKLARQAAKKDSSLAMALLGWMHFQGTVVPQDAEKALSYARDAAEAGEASAMGLLACMYYAGVGVKTDITAAQAWAERAAAGANEFGQQILGLLYASGQGVEKDVVQAWAYLDMAASKEVRGTAKERDALAEQMTRKELAAAKALQQQWRQEWAQ